MPFTRDEVCEMDFSDLMDLVWHEDLTDVSDQLYTDESRNDYEFEDICEYFRDRFSSIEDIISFANDYQTEADYGYWRRDDYGDWEEVTPNDLLDMVLEALDDNGYFETEEVVEEERFVVVDEVSEEEADNGPEETPEEEFNNFFGNYEYDGPVADRAAIAVAMEASESMDEYSGLYGNTLNSAPENPEVEEEYIIKPLDFDTLFRF